MSKISGAESHIMEALWTKGPLTAEELVQTVGPEQEWGEATVKTLINRLLKKKALKSERSGGRALYQALVSREEYVTGESQGLLDRLFGGQLAPLCDLCFRMPSSETPRIQEGHELIGHLLCALVEAELHPRDGG